MCEALTFDRSIDPDHLTLEETLTVSELRKRAKEMLGGLSVELVAAFPRQECPVKHVFTPGLYSRTIFMPAGTIVVSKIHRTRHQYAILEGMVSVWLPETGWRLLEAPFMGVTEPGTQRLLAIHEDTVWATFHPTDETDVDAIEAQIIDNGKEIEL